MRKYIKITRNLSAELQKKYRLNYNFEELNSVLNQYYSRKKRFELKIENYHILIKRKFTFCPANMRDKWDVLLNCSYQENYGSYELILTTKFFNSVPVIIMLTAVNLFFIIVSDFTAPVVGLLIISSIICITMIPNLISKYNGTVEVIKELEKVISDDTM